jgi:hypothetical protein
LRKCADQLKSLLPQRLYDFLIGGFDRTVHFRRIAGRAEMDGAAA